MEIPPSAYRLIFEYKPQQLLILVSTATIHGSSHSLSVSQPTHILPAYYNNVYW